MFLSGWIIDDAYVSFRYAHNLVHGRGLVFNPGDRVEGYTNFSWTIMSALAIALRLPPEVVMPVLGLASAVGLLLLVAREGKRLAEADGSPHALAGVPAALLLSCSTSVALYSVCGLETVFFALLETVAIVALASDRPRRFALFSALAFMTRPEAGLIIVGGLLLLGATTLQAKREVRRRFFEAITILAVLVGPYLAFKLAYFGSMLPNTLAAKPPDLMAGVAYVGAGSWPLLGVVAAALVSVRNAERRRRESSRDRSPTRRLSRSTLLLIVWAVLVVSVALEGGDFMPVGRMLLPTLGVLALVADRTLIDVSRWPKRLRDLPGLAVLLGALAYIPVMASASLFTNRQGGLLAETDVGRRRFVEELVRSGVRSVGTFDVGLLGYLAADVTILDLGGLTDRTIARTPGFYWNKEPPEDYLRARAPDAFVFTSLVPPRVDGANGRIWIPPHYVPEDHVKAMSWFAENYTYVGTAEVLEGNYFLHWFARANR